MELLNVTIEQAGYQEKESALEQIDFSVRRGELVGLIGSNGAGKSSIVKTIIGQMHHVKGSIRWHNDEPRFGYIPETPIYYDELTLQEHLEFSAVIHDMDRQTFVRRSEELLQLFGLAHKKDHYIASLSKGMQQKAMLVLGFLQSSPIYIIDEPFIGLDPHGIRELLVLIEQERGNGAGILMSTHVLDTAEKTCNAFLLIDQGRLIGQGSLQDIRTMSGLAEGSLFECYIRLTASSERVLQR